ncbi:MAG: glycosyltransferase family 2 protein, partial [Verrucomicrobiales bacterium]|nr:glycosyltransferase family 2 protein [Verrucomicrobiales bacterium]
TDGTREVAREFGAEVTEQEWLGFRDQKQSALERCREDWVLALDCDEELSPELCESLVDFFRGGGAWERAAGARFARKVWFLGRWIMHGDWYPDEKTRLARRSVCRWGGSREHDRLEVEGAVVKLRGDLNHYSFPSMNRYVEKINVFADEYLARQQEAGRGWSLGHNLFRPVWRFFRCYFLRLGFLDGFPGLWVAVGIAFQAFVRHSRTYEAMVKDKRPDHKL